MYSMNQSYVSLLPFLMEFTFRAWTCVDYPKDVVRPVAMELGAD